MSATFLDDLDRQLVHALQIDGRAPFNQIALALGVSDQTVARRYNRLRAEGAVRVIGLPDAGRFGYVEWLVRVQCTPDAAAGVAAALAQREDTSWVTLTAGGTEIVCVTRSPRDGQGASLLLQKLPRTPRVVGVSGHYILNTFSGGPSGWHGKAHALSYQQIEQLIPDLPPEPPRGQRLEMVDGDANFLATLALDGRAGYAELARAAGWSESTARRRLEQLRDARAVFFDVEIDSTLLGYSTEVMLWLAVPPSELATVADSLASHPEIAFAAATTGSTNLAAIVVCRDADDFYDYLTGRIGALKAIRHIETAPVIHTMKRAGRLLPRPNTSQDPARRTVRSLTR